VVGGAQLLESATHILGRSDALDRLGQEVDDVAVTPELGEVFEGEVHGACDATGSAQVPQALELSLSAAHAVTLRPHADGTLLRR